MVPSASVASDYVGYAVDVDGDLVILGSYGDDSQANESGAAYIFDRSGGTWCETATLMSEIAGAPDGQNLGRFGISVGISGDTAVVGAYLQDEGGLTDAGTAYVFVRDDQGTPDPCDDTWPFQAKLLPSTPQAGAEFGWRVAIDGDTLIVSARLEDAPLSNQGAAYVFSRAGTTWSEVNKLVAPGGQVGDEFGYSVDVDGSYAVVGALKDDGLGTDSGAAFVFADFGGFWGFDTKLDAGVLGAPGDQFGLDVAVDGNHVVAGAQFDDTIGTNAGAAYLFKRSGGAWNATPAWKLLASDGLTGEEFGSAVDISGSTIVVGARFHFESASGGAAYTFEVVEDDFSLLGFGDGQGMATACPCMNESLAGHNQGCKNSGGFGGQIAPLGSTSVSADDLLIRAHNLLPSTPGLLFAGPVALNGGFGIPFGDGLRVAGGGAGTTRRLGFKAPDQLGSATWGPGLISAGGWSAGMTQHFQVWYRDPINSPCGNPFNTTNAIRATLTP